MNDAARSIDRRRERRSAPSRLAPRNREAASGRAQDMQQHRDLPAVYHRNASTATPKPQIVSDKARCVQHPTHSQLFQPERKRRPDSHRSVFSAWFCIRNRQSGTPCRHAFGIAGFEHLVGVLSRVPDSNAMPACIRNHQSGTPCRYAFAFAGAGRERPQARQDRLRREATRWPAGWERCTRERHFHGQGRRAPWHRCRTASCATPASRRCPLPPAAPR